MKNWCFWTGVLEKTLESSLDCKEINLVNPKGNQSWILIGRTDAEAETPILWPSDAKNWLIGKDPDAGIDRRQEEKWTTEDEMVGWYHWLDGHEFEQVLGVGDGLGSLACCNAWSRKELDTTERLNWTEMMFRCESWTIKKVERRIIDAFELWCWRGLLRVSWTARWSNQSILNKISPEYSLKGLMLKLKLQIFGHLMWRTDIGKDPDAERDWGQEEKGSTEDEMVGWHHWFDGHEFELALGVGDGQGSLACCSIWGHKESDTTERLNWTEVILLCFSFLCLF